MYYKLPEDIRKTIYELEESYPFFKPERFRKSYYKHLRNYHKRGFWSAITWGLSHAVVLYIYAALKLDNPDAVDKNDKNIVKTIENFDNIDDFKWVDFQEELIQNVTTLLSQERLADLKLFLRLGLKWFKHAPINMYYHYYDNKPQAYWRKWLIERTYMDDDETLWSTWSQVQRMFWW